VDHCGLNLVLIDLSGHCDSLGWIVVAGDWCWDVNEWYLSLLHANVGNVHVDIDGVLLLLLSLWLIISQFR